MQKSARFRARYVIRESSADAYYATASEPAQARLFAPQNLESCGMNPGIARRDHAPAERGGATLP